MARAEQLAGAVDRREKPSALPPWRRTCAAAPGRCRNGRTAPAGSRRSRRAGRGCGSARSRSARSSLRAAAHDALLRVRRAWIARASGGPGRCPRRRRAAACRRVRRRGRRGRSAGSRLSGLSGMSRCATKRTSGRSMPMPNAMVATTTTGSPERKRGAAARFSPGGRPAWNGTAAIFFPAVSRHALGFGAAAAVDDAGTRRRGGAGARGVGRSRRFSPPPRCTGWGDGSWRRIPRRPSMRGRAGCRCGCADRRWRSARCGGCRGMSGRQDSARYSGRNSWPHWRRSALRRWRTARFPARQPLQRAVPSRRSGETYRRSSWPSISSRVTLRASAGSRSECSAPAAMPSWRRAATWSSIRAMRGETTTAVPGRQRAGTW